MYLLVETLDHQTSKGPHTLEILTRLAYKRTKSASVWGLTSEPSRAQPALLAVRLRSARVSVSQCIVQQDTR